MLTMTADEARAFLLERPRTAKLATVHADGRPHVAPIWFDLDGEAIVFTTWHTTVKAANLRREPRAGRVLRRAQRRARRAAGARHADARRRPGADRRLTPGALTTKTPRHQGLIS